MLSDSILKGIRIREFNRHITNATARLKSFPGATSASWSFPGATHIACYQHYKRNRLIQL